MSERRRRAVGGGRPRKTPPPPPPSPPAGALYPTRCAVCDKPGAVLCGSCAAALPYIDALTACPRCGAPFGVVQCSECTSVLMEPFGYKEPPYDEMASALVLTEAVRRIVTVYKDQNERGLARPMAQILSLIHI